MDFRSALMPFSDFTRARLRGADFSCKTALYVNDYWVPSFSFCARTVLESSAFRTELDGINFSEAALQNASLGGIGTEEQRKALRDGEKIPGSDMEVGISHSKFDNANLEGAAFLNALISENSFKRSKMAGAAFIKVNLAPANSFVGANLKGARFLSVSFVIKISLNDKNLDNYRSDFTDRGFVKRSLRGSRTRC